MKATLTANVTPPRQATSPVRLAVNAPRPASLDLYAPLPMTGVALVAQPAALTANPGGAAGVAGSAPALPLPVPLPNGAEREPRIREALASWATLSERLRDCEQALNLPRAQRKNAYPDAYQKAWRERGRPIAAAAWGLTMAAALANGFRGVGIVMTVGGSTLLPAMMGAGVMTAGRLFLVLPSERLAQHVTNRTLEHRLETQKEDLSKRVEQSMTEYLALIEEFSNRPPSGESVNVTDEFVEIGGLKVSRRSP